MINKHYILFILIFCGYVFNAAEPDSLSLESALRKVETPIQQVSALEYSLKISFGNTPKTASFFLF